MNYKNLDKNKKEISKGDILRIKIYKERGVEERKLLREIFPDSFLNYKKQAKRYNGKWKVINDNGTIENLKTGELENLRKLIEIEMEIIV